MIDGLGLMKITKRMKKKERKYWDRKRSALNYTKVVKLGKILPIEAHIISTLDLTFD